MVKLSDYVIEFLVQKGINDVFMVSGGGIMHLVDSVGRNKTIRYYCNNHEQACAISAEAYARVENKIGACLVTTGPGGVNAFSGMVGAWVDSIPMIVLSGQVRRNLISDTPVIRQKGPQEGKIIDYVKNATKYAKTILDPEMIRYELEYAFYLATSGRPGPVWIDIPLDVQDSVIDENRLVSFVHSSDNAGAYRKKNYSIKSILDALNLAKRPVVIGGTGIHLSHSEELFLKFIDKFKAPVILPYTAKDLIHENHPLNMGVFGGIGQRRANYVLQNSDCVLSLGVGLSVGKVGFNFTGFATRAKKIVVDIDEGQLFNQVIKPDIAVLDNVGEFLKGLLEASECILFDNNPKWTAACADWKKRYPLIIDEFYKDKEHVNSYVFMDKLSDLLSENDVLLTGDGMDCVSYFQSFRVKRGQRTMNNGNWGSMGWDLPAAVGACIGSGKKRTVCVTGDGSFQLNVQELLTISKNKLPIKLIIFNNKGYSSIRATQRSLFDGRYVGADYSSGIGNPDYKLLAAAYGVEYFYVKNNDEVANVVRDMLRDMKPSLCEVNLSPEQEIIPKASAFRRPDGVLESRPLEDMYPFVPREEQEFNMTQFDDNYVV